MSAARGGASQREGGSRLAPYLYVLPLVVLLAFVFGYPVVRIFEFSFKMVRGVDGPWIGWRNYELVPRPAAVLGSGPAQSSAAAGRTAHGRGLAARRGGAAASAWRAGSSIRSLLFLPYILAVPIIAVVMKKMFQFNGPVNEICCATIGLDFLALDWIGSSDVALWTVMLLIVWRESALGIILFLARLLSLDEIADRSGQARRRLVVAAL